VSARPAFDKAGPDTPRDSSGTSDPLVSLARRAVDAYVRSGELIVPDLSPGSGPSRAGVFVSLHNADGSLRGCLGTFVATKPSLGEEIVANAVSAASRDPRFFPVTERELAQLHISVDVLGAPEEVADRAQLDPKRYGLIVRADDGRQALLLPDLVGVDTVERQVDLTCRKGGIDARRDTFTMFRFPVTRHADAEPTA
jgi:AmmeMemoRadiSam system protein A